MFAPRSLPRIIQLPEKLGGPQNFVFLSSVLSTFVDELFPGMEVLGAYQFRRSTWKMHSSEPFSRANERALADDVAAKHYDWICRGLLAAGMEPSVYNIALAWNSGLQAVTTQRAPRSSHRYALRVANLVAEAERRTLAFLKRYCYARTAPLCGNSVGQDKWFIAEHMPRLYRFLNYRIVDSGSGVPEENLERIRIILEEIDKQLQQLAAIIRTEVARWGPIVREANIRAE